MRCNSHLLIVLTLTAVVTTSPYGTRAEEPPASAPPGGAKTVRDFGAVGDGKADDTAALERAVRAGGDVAFPRGVYRITRSIVVDLDRLGPTSLLSSGTARIVMSGAGPAVKFIGTHDGTADPGTVKPNVWKNQRMPTVDGLEILGDHPEAVGIEATGTMQLVVSRVNVRRALHGIHLTRRNRNVIVSNCHLYENRGVGLFLDEVNLHQINVTGCHISYNGGGGVVVRGGGVCNLQVTGCDIEANMAADGPPTANVLVDGGGVTAEIAVTGCTIQHTHTCADSANIRFLGTDRQGRTWGHLTVAGNVLSDTQVNVDVQKARGVSIVGNTFWKGYQYNLRIEESSNVVVGPNVFDRNPSYWDPQGGNNALVVRNCRDVTLTGLHVNGVQGAKAGLIVEDCRRVNVTNCTILDCASAGLLLEDVVHGRVSDCLIRNDRPDAGPWKPLVVSGGQ